MGSIAVCQPPTKTVMVLEGVLKWGKVHGMQMQSSADFDNDRQRGATSVKTELIALAQD